MHAIAEIETDQHKGNEYNSDDEYFGMKLSQALSQGVGQQTQSAIGLGARSIAKPSSSQGGVKSKSPRKSINKGIPSTNTNNGFAEQFYEKFKIRLH